MIRKEGIGRVVFNRGQVFYASSDNKHRLGYSLVRKGIITNEKLNQALQAQKEEGFKRPLGTIMVEMDVVSPEVLEKEIRRHIVEVIHDLLKWEKGSFHFELSWPSEEDVVLESGLNTEFLLLEATRLRDEDSHYGLLESKTDETAAQTASQEAVAWEPVSVSTDSHQGAKAVPKDYELVRLMIEELSKHSTKNEIILLILRFASEIMNRAVIFLAQGQEVFGLSQSGVVLPASGDANKRIREIRIPLAAESVFKSVAEKKAPYKGKLPESSWNRFLIERLGRGWPAEVYVAPLLNEDCIVGILYCDNLPASEAIGETEGLEDFIRVAGPAFGRSMFEGGLRIPE
jgi:hypothetical protein